MLRTKSDNAMFLGNVQSKCTWSATPPIHIGIDCIFLIMPPMYLCMIGMSSSLITTLVDLIWKTICMSIFANVDAIGVCGMKKSVIPSGFILSCCVPRVATRVCDKFTPSGFQRDAFLYRMNDKRKFMKKMRYIFLNRQARYIWVWKISPLRDSSCLAVCHGLPPVSVMWFTPSGFQRS